MEFSLSENEEKVVAAYGVLALHAIHKSANKYDRIMDLKLGEFEREIIDTCRTRPVGMVLDLSKQYIEEEKES